jgi:hypothetical protein
MQQNNARRARAKAARIDRRPAIAATAISILASLFAAYQLFF